MDNQPSRISLPERPLDQIITGWLGVGVRILEIGISLIIGARLLRDFAGFDVLEWVRRRWEQIRLDKLIQAYRREHANDRPRNFGVDGAE